MRQTDVCGIVFYSSAVTYSAKIKRPNGDPMDRVQEM